MKAVILVAGEGSRLRPLTNTTPKPLIKIVGKTILEHNLEHIYQHVTEIILVVKYKQEMFREYFGNNYKNTPISYHEQTEKQGTGAAVENIQSSSDIIIMNGDCIFHKSDLEKLILYPGYGALVQTVDSPEKYGIFKVSSNNTISEVVEKPQKYIGNLANLGVYKFHPEILNLCKDIEKSQRGEYEITDAINSFVKKYSFKAISIENVFLDISYPWDILTANEYFLNQLERTEISGEIEEGVTIKGNIILEEGAILKSGTYIEGNCYIGRNTKIGPNTYLRGSTVIGEGCKIGNAVEVKNSCFGDYSNAAHLSYIGDSIIGNHVNLGGGFSTANLRHDGKDNKCIIKGELINTKRRKLGAIIGDNVKTGINTSTMPGRIIETGSFTLPGEIVK